MNEYFRVFLRSLVSAHFWNILFPCSRTLSNPWKILELSSRPTVTFWAEPLSTGFVLHEFSVSSRAETYSVCVCVCVCVVCVYVSVCICMCICFALLLLSYGWKMFILLYHINAFLKSILRGVFLQKGVLKMCNKFTGKHPCRGKFSIKLFCKVTLWHRCFPVNLLHIFRILFFFLKTLLMGCFCILSFTWIWMVVTHLYVTMSMCYSVP